MEVPETKGKGTRRQWTTQEDVKLVECLLDLASNNHWKGDNGIFRSGYAKQLEKWLHKKIPGCELKAQPHVESRVKQLKKQYFAIIEMLGPKGNDFGWNDKENMIVVEKEIFKEWVKSHPNAVGLYNKPFPYLVELSQVFSKDRANGENTEDPSDAVAAMDKEANEAERDGVQPMSTPLEATCIDLEDESIADTQPPKNQKQGDVGQSSVKKNRKKGRDTNDVMEKMIGTIEKLGNFYEQTKDNIHELASCFKHEKEVVERRMKVYDDLKSVEGLTDGERIRAGIIIIKDNNLTDYFFIVKPHLIKDFVYQIL